MKLRHLVGILAVLLIIWVCLFYYIKPYGEFAPSDGKVQKLTEKTAPNFKLKDSLGKIYDLESFKGQVVLLHFWASWCPPCLPEMPEWVALAKKLSSKNIKLLTVSVDRKWKEANKVLPDHGQPANLISLLDPEGEIPEIFGTFQFPETYLINRDLKIVTKWVGPQDWHDPAIIQAIEKAASDLR